ncbi:MAG: AAA family ATPase, partial [Bacilli bacterium]|nr:AAA family ATPase [Bacilli bacterium]
MLTYIKVTNINSIDTCEIDFTKDKYKFLEENLIGNYVNPIALYGHNGSGKSSLLKAISYLISLMIDPVDNLAPFIVNNFNLDKFVLENKKG